MTTPLAEQLAADALRLSREDRKSIAGVLLSSLDVSDDFAPDESWTAELDRRMEEILSGSVTGIPADEVVKRLLEKYT